MLAVFVKHKDGGDIESVQLPVKPTVLSAAPDHFYWASWWWSEDYKRCTVVSKSGARRPVERNCICRDIV